MTSAPELTTRGCPFPIAALLTVEITPRQRSFLGTSPRMLKKKVRTQDIQLLLRLQDQRAGGEDARQVLELEGQRDDAARLEALVLGVDALDGLLGRRLGTRGQVDLGAGFGQEGDGRYAYPAAALFRARSACGSGGIAREAPGKSKGR